MKITKVKAGLVGLLAATAVGCSKPDDAVRAALVLKAKWPIA